MSITFRRARPDDLGAIVAIFNESVDLPINDEVELITPASRRDWLAEFTDDFPLWVAEQDGRVVGWCGLEHFSPPPRLPVCRRNLNLRQPQCPGPGNRPPLPQPGRSGSAGSPAD